MSDESSKSTQSFIGRLALPSDDPIRPRQHVRRNPYDFRYFDRAQYRLWISDFGLFAHRITRSALAKTLGGMVRPICFAVFRLMTSSNFVGCSTGRSAGFVPLRILST